MEKRGQVTIFIVLGLILLLTVAFFLFAKGTFRERVAKTGNVEQQLRFELDQIEAEINKCIQEETAQITQELLENGGTLENSNYLAYKGKKVSVLCQNIPDKDNCMASPLVKDDVEAQIQEELRNRISECIDLSQFEGKDYKILREELELNLLINPENILLNINYPLALEKEDISVKKEDFSKTVPIPLGEILKVANDVLQQEAATGSFDPISYTVLNLNKYFVEVKKPYPDKVYQVSLKDAPQYIMWFAVTEDGRYERVV